MNGAPVPELTEDAIDAAEEAVREFEAAGLTPPRRLLVAARRSPTGPTTVTNGAGGPTEHSDPG